MSDDDELNTTIMHTNQNGEASQLAQQPSAPADTPQPTLEIKNLLQQILEANQRVISLQLEVEKHQMANASLQMRNELIDKELQDIRQQIRTNMIATSISSQQAAGSSQSSDFAGFDSLSIQSTTSNPDQPSSSQNGFTSSAQFSTSYSNSGGYLQTSNPVGQSSQSVYQAAPIHTIASNSNNLPEFSQAQPSSSIIAQQVPLTQYQAGVTPLISSSTYTASSTNAPLLSNLPVFSHMPSSTTAPRFSVNQPLSGFTPMIPSSTISAPIPHAFPQQSSNGYHLQAPVQIPTPISCAYLVQRDQFGQDFVQTVTIANNNSQSSLNYTPSSSIATTTGPILLPPAYAPLQPLQMETRSLDYRRQQELPAFSGRPEEWPLFKATFVDSTQRYGYTNYENLLRLKRSLHGEAHKAVESLLIHPQHVEQAMESLESTFGRPEQLVRSQIEQARNLPVVDDAHLDRLIQHATVAQNLATYLDTEKTRHHLANPCLVEELLGKLPISRQLDWAEVASSIEPYPTVKDYAIWVKKLARNVSLIKPTVLAAKSTPASSVRSQPPKSTYPRGKHVLLVEKEATKPDSTCSFCNGTHDIRSCRKLLRLSVQERLREIAKIPLCYGCLCNDHLLPACQEKKRCGVDGCPMWHVPELHSSKYSSKLAAQTKSKVSEVQVTTPSQTSSKTSSKPKPTKSTVSRHQQVSNTRSTSNAETSTILNCREGKPEGTLLFRVVPVSLHGPNQTIKTFALLDEGSSVSMIDTDVANKLQLKGITSDLNVQWFGKQSTVVRSRSVTLSISSDQPNATRYSISNLRTVDNLMLPTQSVDRAKIIKSNPHLSDIPFGCYEGAQPKILLGLEHHHLGVPRQTRTNEEMDGIVAADTKIGWVVYGSDGRSPLPSTVVLHVSNYHDPDYDRYAHLHELVREHFTTENFGVKMPSAQIESDDVIRARQILDATTKRVSCRFETGLLWKNDQVTLPDSYNMALRRLASIEAKMRREPEYARQYREQIASYVLKGYARKLSREEVDRRSARTWYLPHFAVSNVNKPGKFRLVFDAAATVMGVSLNSVLLSGPDVNVPLSRILFQFRIGSVGVCGDIREMYHQVLVRPADQDAQRFLWREGNSQDRPDVYVMQVMTFGATCSPASAQHVKNVNAIEFKDEMTEAADAIQRFHYVDDYVASFTTAKDAERITSDVIELHRRGGFELRGIISNSERVREKFSGDLQSGESSVSLDSDSTTEKILGMSWDTADDTFRFMTRFNRVHDGVVDGSTTPTKREILSTSMSIFDPFGLLADFVIASKLILQDLWRLGIGWDDPVPNSVNERWQSWRSQIIKTQLVRVPRCYSPHLRKTPDLQLHVFADASETAFAAVAYWRIVVEDQIELAFIAGKARCAPIKLLSIPRLELQAAVLATRLLVEIRESHDFPVSKSILWSDSETVLKWLRSDQRRYKPFVAFRVAEVVESAPASWWRWVPTALNVADDATRVGQPFKYEPNGRWTRGPEWLCEKEEHWPVQTPSKMAEGEVDEEARSKFVGVVSCRGPVDYARFSKFYRLCRAVAWANRFASNSRHHSREKRQGGELSSTEVSRAENVLCHWVQSEMFGSELAALRAERPISQGSQLFLLKPYLDDDGLMRVHGRTDAADEEFMSRDAKRPILLPDDHHFTRLLVRHHHERMAHQLVDATIAAVRSKYWVPRLRKLARQVQLECQHCRLRLAKPTIPSQGQLPHDRMDAYKRPFTNTGLDYFGPVTVTVGRRHEKRWVALFTCLTTRAVHLEIAADLSTDACLTCIRNLCNIRGVPSLIRCDNGTNFIGARNELAKEKNFFDPNAIQRDLSTRGVEWKFNCPANPEAGGAWERLVQSIKRVLRVTLHEEAPRVETLRALLLEAANMVNSRPLTNLQVDPFDLEPITPNHFLLGGPNQATIPSPADVEPRATRKQWQICRGLSRTFWKQWVRDYLPELTQRSKHYPEKPPLKVGDLVIVCDEHQPRSKWIRGRIEAVMTGPDGIVRTATLRTKDGTMRRPITKLAVLEIGPSPNRSTDGGRNIAICRQK